MQPVYHAGEGELVRRAALSLPALQCNSQSRGDVGLPFGEARAFGTVSPRSGKRPRAFSCPAEVRLSTSAGNACLNGNAAAIRIPSVFLQPQNFRSQPDFSPQNLDFRRPNFHLDIDSAFAETYTV